jgi:hypothetical protein
LLKPFGTGLAKEESEGEGGEETDFSGEGAII